jgi:hypothetical protein
MALMPWQKPVLRPHLDNTVSSDVILAILSRKHDEPQPEPVQQSSKLPQLTLLPIVDCRRYDLLLSGGAHGTA